MAEADPLKIYNVHQAKTHLSKLIDRAHAGEEIIVAKAGEPWARIVPYAEPAPLPPRKPGRLAGMNIDPDIWFEPMSDEERDIWEGKNDPLV